MKDRQDPIFAIAADNWINDVACMNKYGTLKSIRLIVRNLNVAFGHMNISQIKKIHIQSFIVRMNMRVGVEYLKHHISAFKGIMEYADDDWVLPRIKLPKRSGRPKQEFYSFEEVRKLLGASTGQQRVLIALLAETGCRLGEALALQTADVTPEEISITKNVYEGILQSTPKTESSVRKVAISKTLWYGIESIVIKDKPRAFVFRSATNDRPAWPVQLGEELKLICTKAGVPYKAFHAFRRGNITECITVLLIPEKIVGYRVGHLSEGTTLGVYCKVHIGSDKLWVDKIEELLYGSKQS